MSRCLSPTMSNLLCLIIFPTIFLFSSLSFVSAHFTDISSDDYLHSYIQHLQDKQLISGYPDGTFRPTEPISRAEIVALVVRTIGAEQYSPTEPTFSDVLPNHWAYEVIEIAYKEGIVGGYPDAAFRPENTVTIAEMATILVNLAGLTVDDIDNLIIMPELDGHWAEEKIKIAIANGLIEVTVNDFDPNSPATRGQAAIGLVKVINLSTEFVKMEENVSSPEQNIVSTPSRSSNNKTQPYIIELIEILGTIRQSAHIFSKDITQGEECILPTHVKVLFSNNEMKDIAVNWDAGIVDTQECGVYQITGSLVGYNNEVTLVINVLEPTTHPQPDPIVNPPADNGSGGDGGGTEPEEPQDIVEITITFDNEGVFDNNHITGIGQLKVNDQAIDGVELEFMVIDSKSILVEITDVSPSHTNNEGYFNISFKMPENLYGEFTLQVIYLEEIYCIKFNIEEPVYTGRKYFTFNSSTGTITNYNINGGLDVLIPPTIDGVRVTAIGSSAFNNKNLTSVVIPDSVTTIGSEAFRNNKLTNLIIPNSVTHIGGYAFTSNLISTLSLPHSLISIGDGTFASNKLREVTIPDSITTLADSLFFENELTDVTLPNNLLSIGQYTFRYNKLTSILIPSTVTTIRTYAFSNNLLESVHLPDSIRTINTYAFSNNNLTHISLSNGLTSIENSIFRNNKLTSVVIPNTVTTIYNYAFENNNLSSIALPTSLKEIGFGALQNNNLTCITLGSGVTIGNKLLNSSNDNFRDAYNPHKVAGTYTGTQTGPWCLSPP